MAGKYLSLLVYFSWSTAGRQPWIEPSMRENLYSYIGGIMNNKNAGLISAGGMFDHIHLYASMPSTTSVTDFVNVVKSNSSKWIHESFSKLRNFAWQEGYGAFSVRHKKGVSSFSPPKRTVELLFVHRIFGR